MREIYRKKPDANQGERRPPRRKKRNRKPILLLVSLFVVVAALSVALVALPLLDGNGASQPFSDSLPAGAPSAALPAASLSPPPEPEQLRLRFSAVGDNLIHNGIYLQAATRAAGNGYDFNYVYENLRYFFEDFDVNWINQETLVNNELPPDTYPCFSTPGELGQAAYDAGWRVFALSNNHTYDKLAAGVSATMRYWEGMPDDVVTPGLFTNNEDDSGIKLHTVNGITLAYVSYTEHTNGIPTPSGTEAWVVYTDERDVMERQIRRATELADAVVAGVHWGVEGSHVVTDAQRALAADFANWGATVVIGTHPHVVQPVEWVQSEDGRDVLVAYSLGNFLSAQSAAENMVGMALCFELAQTVQPNGQRGTVTVEEVQVHPTVTHYDANYTNIRDYMFRDYTPELAAQHGVRARNPAFSVEYIRGLMEQYVDEEFLVLD